MLPVQFTSAVFVSSYGISTPLSMHEMRLSKQPLPLTPNSHTKRINAHTNTTTPNQPPNRPLDRPTNRRRSAGRCCLTRWTRCTTSCASRPACCPRSRSAPTACSRVGTCCTAVHPVLLYCLALSYVHPVLLYCSRTECCQCSRSAPTTCSRVGSRCSAVHPSCTAVLLSH